MRFFFIILLFFSPLAFAADDGEVFNIPESESDTQNLENSDNLEHALKDFSTPKTEAVKETPKEAPRKEINKASDEKPAESAAGNNIAVIQGLNKVVGRVSNFEAIVGAVAHFENLEIIVHKCTNSSISDQPENSALLEIRETKGGEEPKQIFLGWMFSSSPSLSALEHPVYDITILSCETRANIEQKP